MQSLLYKDLSLFSWLLLIYPFFFWMFCIFEVDHGSTDFSICAYLIMSGFIMSTLDELSNKHKTDGLMISLPVTRKEILQSKYMGAVLVGLTLILTTLALNVWVGFSFDYHPPINYWTIYLGIWFPIIVGIPLLCSQVNGWVNGVVQVVLILFFVYGVYPLMKSPFIMALLPILLYPISWFIANIWYQKREF